MRGDIRLGALFPDYELTDHAGTRRRLSELQGNDPMILILSRGHFCPRTAASSGTTSTSIRS
jgi:peroxiredoxin